MKTETGMMKTRGGILVIIITLIFFFFVLKEVHLLVPTLTSQFCVILCYLLHLTTKILPSSLLYISFISSLFKFRLPGFHWEPIYAFFRSDLLWTFGSSIFGCFTWWVLVDFGASFFVWCSNPCLKELCCSPLLIWLAIFLCCIVFSISNFGGTRTMNADLFVFIWVSVFNC